MFRKLVSQLEQNHLQTLARRGGLSCPQCQEPMQDVPQQMDQTHTCPRCGYFGTVSDWISADGKLVGHADRPPVDTRITKEGGMGTRIWNIPASGRSGGLVAFGWLWSTFVGGMFLFVLVMSAMGKGEINKEPATLPKALGILPFMLPFLAIGAGMLYFGYRSKKTRHKVEIGAGRVVLRRIWRGEKEKSLPLADVECVEQVVFYSQNYKPVHGIEIKGKSGKLRFGSSLTDAEKAWLVADFQRAVWPETTKAAGHAPASQVKTTEAYGAKPFSIVLPKSFGVKSMGVSLTIIGIAFLAIGIFLLPDRVGPVVGHGKGFVSVFDSVFAFFRGSFQTIWCLMSVGALVGGITCLTKLIRGREVELRLEGDERQLALRKSKKGLLLCEQLFPREEFRDIRARKSGSMNGKAMMKIELLFSNRVEKIAGWVEESQAHAVVAEIKCAMS